MRPIAHSLPFGRATFIPAGCIHWPLTEKDLLKKWIKAVKDTPKAFTMLMGDSLDFARTHYRDHIRSYRADQNSQLAVDEYVKHDIGKLAKLLMPIKDRIIGAILGNHHHEFADGTNGEQFLCQLLGIRYLGPVGLIRVDFRDRSGRTRHSMVIYAHHHGGSMGGRTTGADANALERSETTFDADVYVLSHTHRRIGFKLPKLEITSKGRPIVIERTKAFIRSGAFLKGYGEDNPSTTRPHFPTYAEQKALRPTDLGYVTLTIDLTHVGNNGPNDPNRVKREFTVSY